MRSICISAVLVVLFASSVSAEDFLSHSGRVSVRGVVPLDSASETEYPSLMGRLQVDTLPSPWRFHLWLEGGWDGTVAMPARDHALLKTFDEVYQSTTPYLEFKELYGSYSSDILEVRAGVQRFAWGRLDEFPVNDLLNPWDYTRFITKSLEDRKIGVPSVSARLGKGDWSLEAVWVPLLVPYRLPLPNERWSGIPGIPSYTSLPGTRVTPAEPDLPARTLGNSSVGMRLRNTGPVEWALNLFHGYDPKPVFTSTALVIAPLPYQLLINPGYVPDFHKITSIGFDLAAVMGDWSLRAEAAYKIGRYFNTRTELWGYPATLASGVYPLNPIEHKSDTVEYGIGVDYRLVEDCLLTMQAQQVVITNRPETLYERQFETLFWANLKNGWLNQKVETNLNVAYNPEHGDIMAKANAWYTFTDSWKAGLTGIVFAGNSQSLFGRFSKNEQLEAEVVFSW
jgi:hypothetical protein